MTENKTNKIKENNYFDYKILLEPKYYDENFSTKNCKVINIFKLEKDFNFNHNKSNERTCSCYERLVNSLDGYDYLWKRSWSKEECNITFFFEIVDKCLYFGLFDFNMQQKVKSLEIGNDVGQNENSSPIIFLEFDDYLNTYNKFKKICEKE